MAVNPAADQVETSRAPFVEHLRELRSRLIKAFAAVAIGFSIAWIWVEEVFNFLKVPLIESAENAELAEIHTRSLTENFFVSLKTGLFAGVVLAVPVILYQIWKFVAPGLYPDERRATLPFVFFSTIFFLIGASFCYYIILPYAYGFLLTFGEEVATPMLMMEEYLAITTKMLLAFGVVFEMPVFASFLAKIGVVNWRMMIGFWKYAFVLCFVVGAMLTPPDLISQLFLAGPMFVLYMLSVFAAFVFGPKMDKEPKEEATDEG